jgi:hypothetical protein
MRYQEGEPPVEDAAALLAQARDVADEIEDLVRRINRTNAANEEPGLTLTAAIARRDALAVGRKLTVAVADGAAGDHHGGWARQLWSELGFVTDLPVAQFEGRGVEELDFVRVVDRGNHGDGEEASVGTQCDRLGRATDRDPLGCKLPGCGVHDQQIAVVWVEGFSVGAQQQR